jgi:hypothetical protein
MYSGPFYSPPRTPPCRKPPFVSHTPWRSPTWSGRGSEGEEPVSSKVVHFQFGAVDADRLASFYRDVFGWSILDARLTSLEADLRGPTVSSVATRLA